MDIERVRPLRLVCRNVLLSYYGETLLQCARLVHASLLVCSFIFFYTMAVVIIGARHLAPTPSALAARPAPAPLA